MCVRACVRVCVQCEDICLKYLNHRFDVNFQFLLHLHKNCNGQKLCVNLLLGSMSFDTKKALKYHLFLFCFLV